MIVDLVRNDLGRVCEYGSVHVAELMTVEPHPTVFQMTSTVRGRLAAGRDGLDLVRAAFPGGSMTGAPKIAAMKIIDDIEPVARGIYSGAIGYLDAWGALDLNIVIRTVIRHRERCYLNVGGAVVADSDPHAEYDETMHKAHALKLALAGAIAAGSERGAGAGRGSGRSGPRPSPSARLAGPAMSAASLGRVLVAGAAGGFGRLLGDLARDAGAEVAGVDVAQGGAWMVGDIAAPDARLRDALAATDTLLLCVPETAALAAIGRVAGELPAGALVVDTLSVKTPVAARWSEVQGALEVLSLNPLFAPDVGLRGEAVAAVTLRGGPRGRALLHALAAAGADVLELDADEHDRRAAGAQAAVHAAVLGYGAYLARAGADPRFSTPAQRGLLALLARVAGFDSEVYRHIQADNPHAAAAREQLAWSVCDIGVWAAEPSGERFAALFAQLRRLCDPDAVPISIQSRGDGSGGSARGDRRA